MTKTAKLQQLADELRTPEQWEFEIVWRGVAGWWAIPSETRYFNDDGEFLGHDTASAETTLRRLLG